MNLCKSCNARCLQDRCAECCCLSSACSRGGAVPTSCCHVRCLAVQAAFMRQKMERHEVAVQKAAEEKRAAEVGLGWQTSAQGPRAQAHQRCSQIYCPNLLLCAGGAARRGGAARGGPPRGPGPRRGGTGRARTLAAGAQPPQGDAAGGKEPRAGGTPRAAPAAAPDACRVCQVGVQGGRVCASSWHRFASCNEPLVFAVSGPDPVFFVGDQGSKTAFTGGDGLEWHSSQHRADP